MRLALIHLVAAAPLAFVAAPAVAQDSMMQPVSSEAIMAGKYAKAEHDLLAELRIHPGRPELLLNLAAVYSQTNRPDEARALYQRVLSQDDVLMDLAVNKTVGSHAIARTGLDRLNTRMTAR